MFQVSWTAMRGRVGFRRLGRPASCVSVRLGPAWPGLEGCIHFHACRQMSGRRLC